MREDPIAREEAALVVELADGADRAAFEDAVAALDGTVERDLRFATALVRLPQPAVDDLCALDGIARIETANAIGVAGDAGEDL